MVYMQCKESMILTSIISLCSVHFIQFIFSVSIIYDLLVYLHIVVRVDNILTDARIKERAAGLMDSQGKIKCIHN